MSNITLRVLKNTDFPKLYRKIIQGEVITERERYYLLKLSVVFINDKVAHIRDLGYRIIVYFAINYKEYRPLFDVSINLGYYPVTYFSSLSLNISDDRDGSVGSGFFSEFSLSFLEGARDGSKYLTKQQIEIFHVFRENKYKDVAVVAPTSYGKSELYTSFCRDNPFDSICIIVPTKALLSQAKKRIKDALSSDDRRKIVTHPDMYKDSKEKCIFVLTQERYLRILEGDFDLNLDFLFIDEAHNIFSDDQRGVLLAQILIVTKKRNDNVRFKFITPFVSDVSNLVPRYIDIDLAPNRISEKVKTEGYRYIDFYEREGPGSKLRIYDQYISEFMYDRSDESVYLGPYEFILRNSSHKNIVYFNKPKSIEIFSVGILEWKESVVSERLDQICKNISSYVHKDYRLIECLKKGVVYHHGSLPDIVKLYVEEIFSTEEFVSHIVTSSTLLEGVNIPGDRMFLLDIFKGRRHLTPSQFQNLVGRICRFSEVFNLSKGDIRGLIPKIFLVKSAFVNEDARWDNFISTVTRVDKEVEDTPKNVLLDNVDIDDSNLERKNLADLLLENIERGSTGEDVQYAVTKVGKLCFKGNVVEIDILDRERNMQNMLDVIDSRSINSSSGLISVISDVFISNVSEKKHFSELRRLNNLSAQNFYSMFIDWRVENTSYAEMINVFLKYWKKIEDPIVFVGSRWGEVVKEEYDAYSPSWIDIRGKSDADLVNLAIVRVKEEQDFVDNNLIKYLEILYECDVVEEVFYLKVKYGTSDRVKIVMLNNGINIHLANLLLDQYSSYIDIDVDEKQIRIDPDLIQEMTRNGENEILVFEAKFHVGG